VYYQFTNCLVLGVTVSPLDEATYQIFAPNQQALDEAKEMIDELLSEEVCLTWCFSVNHDSSVMIAVWEVLFIAFSLASSPFEQIMQNFSDPATALFSGWKAVLQDGK